jgi:imidazole glycerol-phosphate synthase subunit HisF
MLRKRIIVCLDVRCDGGEGRVVKGVKFAGLRDVGDPVELAARYQAEGADEVVFLDVSASLEGRRTLLDVVRRTAEQLFVPLTVGGGIGDVDDVGRALRAGADTVSVNSAAVARPELLGEAAARYGRQCVVASIDARAEPAAELAAAGGDGQRRWRVATHGGTRATALDAVEWAARCAELGAGEVLLTSIDRDGGRDGFDLELTSRVAAVVGVPVIASGGAGTPEHFRDAFVIAGADAALAAGIFHDGVTTVGAVKRALGEAGVPVRLEVGA